MMQNKQPSEWLLDRLHVGEATPLERSTLEEGWSDDSVLFPRLRQREESFARLHQQPGFDAFLEQEFERHRTLPVEEPVEDEASATPAHAGSVWTVLQQWFGTGWAPLATLGVTVLCMTWISLPNPNGVSTQVGSEGRHQGKVAIWKPKSRQASSSTILRALYFRKGSPYSKWAKSKQTLAPGDFLQFSLHTSLRAHAMIVGMNQKGEVYVVVPFQGKVSRVLDAGRVRLPAEGSFELDDYLGWERFYLFTAKKSFTFQQVKGSLQRSFVASGKAIRTLRAVPGPWDVTSLLIQKTKKPSLE